MQGRSATFVTIPMSTNPLRRSYALGDSRLVMGEIAWSQYQVSMRMGLYRL